MAFHIGYGGKCTVVGTPNVDVCIGKWVGTRKKDRVVVATSCGRTNLASFPSIEGTIELPYDDSNTIETIGIDVGDKPTVRFYLGDSTHYYTATVLIESAQFTVDNASGAVMIVLGFVADVTIGTPEWAYT